MKKTISPLDEVRKFVLDLRSCAGGKNGANVVLIPRDGLQQALADLGITMTQAKGIVADLKMRDYCSGPDEDEDLNLAGECIWIFCRLVRTKLVYIKLKLVKKNVTLVKCLSFHPPRYPLNTAYDAKEIEEFKKKLGNDKVENK